MYVLLSSGERRPNAPRPDEAFIQELERDDAAEQAADKQALEKANNKATPKARAKAPQPQNAETSGEVPTKRRRSVKVPESNVEAKQVEGSSSSSGAAAAVKHVAKAKAKATRAARTWSFCCIGFCSFGIAWKLINQSSKVSSFATLRVATVYIYGDVFVYLGCQCLAVCAYQSNIAVFVH